MSKSNNGEMQDKRLIPQGDQRRYTGEFLLRTRPKTYRAIVRELAEPNASVNGISRRYRVSNHTVMGIREREAKSGVGINAGPGSEEGIKGTFWAIRALADADCDSSV